MSFQPILPQTGLVGFRLLERTEATQRALFDKSPDIARNVAYFTEKIGEVKTAGDLVGDRRLLRVALGAFGLDDDIGKGAFLRRMLEEGSEDPQSFANRLVDPRYKAFVRAFGFGDIGGARTGRPGFAAEITSAYRDRQFEIAVGDRDEGLRLALNFRREIGSYAGGKDPDGAGWFSVMGDLPVRRVFEGAFGLSSSFGQLDIDRQRDDLRALNRRVFGDSSLAIFAEPAKVDEAIRRFLTRRAIEDGPSPATPGFTALTLLGASRPGLGPAGLQNIVLAGARPG